MLTNRLSAERGSLYFSSNVRRSYLLTEMETSAIDELYGDLAQEHHDSVLNYDEDTVDIYSGLEDSPNRNKDHGKKNNAFVSPNRVKESLDLYEELITEEQEEKDTTYNELKSKFVAAQNQVQDLLARLQQMQTKNSSLHHENTQLKKNICALIKTAKIEIVRKDEVISKLSKRSNRGGFHPSSKERGHDAYSRSSPSVNTITGPVRESQERKRDEVPAEVSQGRPTFHRPGDPSEVDSTPLSSVILTRSNLDKPLNRQNKDSHGLDLLPNSIDNRQFRGNSSETSKSSETSTRQSVCDEAGCRRGMKQAGKESASKEDSCERSQTKMDKNGSERDQKKIARSTCGSSSSENQLRDDLATLRRSGHSRSPSSHASSSTPESRLNIDMQSRKDEPWHKQGQERPSEKTEVSGCRSEKSSSDKSHGKMEKRGSREHHRKEERRQEGTSSSERRRNKTDGIKEREYRKTRSEERNRGGEKNSNRGERKSTRSEISKEHERQSGKDSGTTRRMGNHADKSRVSDGNDRSRADVRENRRHASPLKPHHSAQDLRKDPADRRRTSDRTEASSRSKASSGHGDTRGETCTSSDRHGVGKGKSDKEKRSGSSDKGSKIALDNARIHKTSEDGNVQADGLANTRRKSPVRLTGSCDSSAMREESSPKRKLTFMETLNLTLSPVKTQNTSEQPREPAQTTPDDTLASNPTKDRSLFEVGEEFCVIDEVEDVSEDDSLALLTDASKQPHDLRPPTSLEVKGKELELPQRSFGDLNETRSGKADGTDTKMQDGLELRRTRCISQHKSVMDKTSVSELSKQDKPVENPTDVNYKEGPQASVKKNKERRRTGAKDSGEQDGIDDKPEESAVQNKTSQKKSVMPNTPPTDPSVCLEVVSSTVGLENNNRCKETISVSDMEITQVTFENADPCPGPQMGPSTEPANITTTARESGTSPEQASSSEPDSTENEIPKPSQSVVEHYDEDSMMLTLSNIKVIPELISPLTSPIRQIKKVQQQQNGKESHVKSLSKVADKDAVKMDMNKENKRPDSLVPPSVQKDQQEALSSTVPEEDLEEGEIISESDGEGALVIQSPPNEKRASLRNQSSPRSPSLQKKSQIVTPRQKQKKPTTSKDSPSSNKRRFKTVTVPPKAKISTSAEFMNMLLFIRSELRRKYMKLHKNVTKPAFICIVEMSQASYTEYVDSINFDKFCSQGNRIKPLLNKIIQTLMAKVSDNGIVNRIFEQQAEDLKQKLWNFVDGQFDFLFKELKAALKSATDLQKNKTASERKESNPSAKEDAFKLRPKEPLSTTENRPRIKSKGETDREGQKVQEQTRSSHSLPCRGLGSSGKNIKATMEEEAKVLEVPPYNHSNQQQVVSASEKSLHENVPAPENIPSNYTRRLSHTGSIQDRADFEILTEQQTSSLTFNLVTDSQMGDIFRCLLQGSDLLENSDHPNWPLSTPRKECQAGDNLLGVITPSKMITPSKLITTWTSVSPYKFQMPLNPALLDENCMLEVPSNAVPNQLVAAVATASSQQHYSILAEDLAVSLTIPSPLKSDCHLSFLNPDSGHPLSTPSNVISAHYSEDALLDGEDATEQDIHLSLETDNSSSPSSTSGNWEAFQFKPNLPMQAEVMERSNDHFIVRIRQTSVGVSEDPVEKHKETLPAAEDLSSHRVNLSLPVAGRPQVTSSEEEILQKNNSEEVLERGSSAISPKATESQIVEAHVDAVPAGVEAHVDAVPAGVEAHVDADPAGIEAHIDADPAGVAAAATESEHVVEDSCQRESRKRKKHHSGSKAKRSRREKSQDKPEKQRHKKRSKTTKEKNERTPLKKIKTPSPQLSPNSLSAKNVIRKKGEVVATWTREEDRDILVALKTKGPSSKTFAALASKLGKSEAQIEERFSQLMKLFKKKEKMGS
ncbi:CASP8-associated protein 2 isoform X2 [Tachysurus fulvidraco]|uniref:CASP8-associated protein 2 isoform X2 n=1 Tax=Tachysurus fulvidraco TaxID=1234273 RepID=UPI001FED3CB5|nr:CASP8-associated protein 2 isoform X2 [Tachysurus fulvidraco]